MYRAGIDLGGTNIKAGIVDEQQHIIAEASVPTNVETFLSKSPSTKTFCPI